MLPNQLEPYTQRPFGKREPLTSRVAIKREVSRLRLQLDQLDRSKRVGGITAMVVTDRIDQLERRLALTGGA